LAARQESNWASKVDPELGEECKNFLNRTSAKAQIVAQRQTHEDAAFLRDESEACAGSPLGRGMGRCTLEQDLTTSPAQLSRQAHDGRGLAGAVGPEKGKHLSRMNG